MSVATSEQDDELTELGERYPQLVVEMCRLRAKGLKHTEIAAELCISRDKVRRALALVCERNRGDAGQALKLLRTRVRGRRCRATAPQPVGV